jgi:hypothetical protein
MTGFMEKGAVEDFGGCHSGAFDPSGDSERPADHRPDARLALASASTAEIKYS